MRAYRPDKMASLIRDVVSETMTNKLQDPRISPFASITRVEVTGDLQIAKVYVSVMGSETEGRTTLRGLENARGILQRAVARAVTARVCPQLRFIYDGSIKKASEIIALIDASLPREESPADVEDQEADEVSEDHPAEDGPSAERQRDVPPSDGVGP